MRPNIIVSCLLIFLFIHEFSSSLSVDARSLQYYSYNELFKSHQHMVSRELRGLKRRIIPTPSPPKPNVEIHWSPPPPLDQPPPPGPEIHY
ncbi:hypothetical protein H5410_020034 [Solanum commersonii]|uniref:Transmembrane protein n=1 Tax=Solanum commersonii TaxID=4109 RepID=A0A9J5Z794_SOLCO|nr:hypothetical protein H5410_020034 [Solanum commersonii]